jgi:hypothetical protein
MASSGKTKTTMAKRTRENKLRERRLEKKARKEARKLASADQADQGGDAVSADDPTAEAVEPGAEQPPVEAVIQGGAGA